MESRQGLWRELEAGRTFLGRLAHGGDLVESIERFCREQQIETAVFHAIGALTAATLGAYDHKQQVYVTYKKEGPLEIVHCTGNLTVKEGQPFLHAHAVLADLDGQTLGGHLFSGCVVFAGEVFVQELLGLPLVREHDVQTGLFLWKDL